MKVGNSNNAQAFNYANQAAHAAKNRGSDNANNRANKSSDNFNGKARRGSGNDQNRGNRTSGKNHQQDVTNNPSQSVNPAGNIASSNSVHNSGPQNNNSIQNELGNQAANANSEISDNNAAATQANENAGAVESIQSILDNLESQIANNQGPGNSDAASNGNAANALAEVLERLNELFANASSNSNQGNYGEGNTNQDVNNDANDAVDNTDQNEDNTTDGNSDAEDIIEDSVDVNETVTNFFGLNALNESNKTGTGSVSRAYSSVTSKTGNTIAAQNLDVSGIKGTATVEIGENATAREVADKINEASNLTGVNATASTVGEISNLSASGVVSFGIGSSKTNSLTEIKANVSTDDLSDLADAINKVSNITGITAEQGDDLSKLTLRQAFGENIVINNFKSNVAGNSIDVGGEDGAETNLVEGQSNYLNKDSAVISGSVSLVSAGEFNIKSSADDSNGSIIDKDASVSQISQSFDVSNIDLSTKAGVDTALSLIDDAKYQTFQAKTTIQQNTMSFNQMIESLTAQSGLNAAIAEEMASTVSDIFAENGGDALLTQANALKESSLALLSQ